MNTVHLSARLQIIADYVPQGGNVADIGSDHAYLPAFLLQNQRIRYALAGEVAVGPLANAQGEIVRQQLQGRLIARLGNGLDVVQTSDRIDTVVIAGMGGLLIRDILQRDYDYHNRRQFPHLILQANTEEMALRKWLMNHHYRITTEQIVQEGSHFYEIMVVTPGDQELELADLAFGPYLRRAKSPVFQAKWLGELDRIQLILERLKTAQKQDTDLYQQWQRQARRIEEAIA